MGTDPDRAAKRTELRNATHDAVAKIDAARAGSVFGKQKF